MGKKYNNEELVAILNENEKIYRKDCLNIKGNTKDGRPCVEILAQNISFSDIKPYEEYLKKTFVYKREEKKIDTKSEKGLCRCWFLNHEFDENVLTEKLGTPIQYEVNLIEYCKVNIDLVSYKDGTLYIIEVKGRGRNSTDKAQGDNYYYSPESLLRCALEIRTYYKTLLRNIDKFKADLGYPNANVKMAILIPEDGEAAHQLNNPDYPFSNKFVLGNNDIENPEIEVVIFKGKEKKVYKHKSS